MAFKVQVGSPQIFIHQDQTILTSELDGQIEAQRLIRALQRLACETQADVARTYAVDPTTVGRLDPFDDEVATVVGAVRPIENLSGGCLKWASCTAMTMRVYAD